MDPAGADGKNSTKDVNVLFCPVTEKESAEAYQVLSTRTEELIRKGTGQYVAPFPSFDEYYRRTELGQNWLLRDKKGIVAIVSLIDKGIGSEWSDFHLDIEHYWISSLFVSLDSKNQGFGKAILNECKLMARNHGKVALLLDCYIDSGFLENYYIGHGFRTIGVKTFQFPNREFRAALMEYLIDSTEDAKLH